MVEVRAARGHHHRHHRQQQQQEAATRQAAHRRVRRGASLCHSRHSTAAAAEPTKLPSETSAENMEMRHRFRCQYVPVDSAGDVYGLDASPDYLLPSGFALNNWRRCSVFLSGSRHAASSSACPPTTPSAGPIGTTAADACLSQPARRHRVLLLPPTFARPCRSHCRPRPATAARPPIHPSSTVHAYPLTAHLLTHVATTG